MDQGSAPRVWSLVPAIALLPVVVVGVIGTWVVSSEDFGTTTRSTGLTGGNALIGVVCILVAITLAVLAVLCWRRPRDVALEGAFRRALLFGGIAGAVACGIRAILAANWTVSASGHAAGISRHPAWGVWLTTACFVAYTALGLAVRQFGPKLTAGMAPQQVWSPEVPAGSADATQVVDIPTLMQAAFINGDAASLDALTAAGPDTVTTFRDVLSGSLRLDLPADRPRLLMDNASAVSCKLGISFPEKYAAVFADVTWMRHSEVLMGLGYSQRPEAIPVLITALKSELPGTTRLCAAIGLRYFAGPEPVAALTSALNDPDDLVRHHASESLTALGVSPSV